MASKYFNVSCIYDANYNSPKKVNVNQGGTSSGKTYSILQVLATIALEDKSGECIITVVGQDIPNLKVGALRDMERIVKSSPALLNAIRSYNKSDRVYYFKNGSIIEFNSYDNEQDAKSGKRHYLFINECNGISYDIYRALALRTRYKIFLDYNPTARFWVHEHLIGKDNVIRFISDHRHNPFLSKEQHAEIEGIDDPEYWKVYARGMTGIVFGLIYPKIVLIDAMPPNLPSVLGLDFGYNHKMALLETAKDLKKLFWDELIYASNLTINDLIPQMLELKLHETKKIIYADPSAADKIEDLRRVGFNIHKADKDVKNGIDYCKGHTIYVTRQSAGTRKEALAYKWKVDKRTGLTLDEPVKFMDDAMDAGRYGSYSSRIDNKINASSGQIRKSLLDTLN